MSVLFEPGAFQADPSCRLLVELLPYGLEAVDPYACVLDNVSPGKAGVLVGGHEISPGSGGRLAVVAVGKASGPMAAAAAERFGDAIDVGLVVGPGDPVAPEGWRSYGGGHPAPTAGSLRAGEEVLDLATSLEEGDTLVVLLSGGASALLEAPVEGVGLEDLARITNLLLRAGATIGELNAVRRRLSRIKGGGLADACGPARVVTLVLSDVVGSPVHDIGSGPTVTDPTTIEDAREVLARYGVEPGVRLRERDYPVTNTSLSILGDGSTAAHAILHEATRRGIPARVASVAMEGEAAVVARECVAGASEGLTIWAGETTVTVTGDGRGGRNQEGALSAALALAGDTGMAFAAFGTDGVDGPTDAAGGIVGAGTVASGVALGLTAARFLERNDAYTYLGSVGSLLRCGPTGTNVGDLWLAWRPPR